MMRCATDSGFGTVSAAPVWRCRAPALHDDEALRAEVIAVHHEQLAGALGREPGINPALGIQIHALRQVEDWRLLLLLTPWMFARLFFPDQDPGLLVPPDWDADVRQSNADAVLVLGPRVDFTLLGQSQQAHLNLHPRIGHYLIQPLVLDMAPFTNAEEVFAQWNEVIEKRDQAMAREQRDCPLQKEISRREWFRRLAS